METITIEAQNRELQSRGQLNAMRRNGWIPIVLYGESKRSSSKGKQGSTMLKIERKNFLKSLRAHGRSNLVVELKWGKEAANAVIKEIQTDIMTQGLIHVDFQRIVMTEKLEVNVPIHFEGESPGVKLSGGILEHITRDLKIVCLPKDIPKHVSVDVSKLEIGQSISVKDIGSIPGVQILSDPDQMVANVVAPTILEEITPAVEPLAAEPEVIAKGKKPEEGAEGAEPAPAAGKPQDKAGKPQDKAEPKG